MKLTPSTTAVATTKGQAISFTPATASGGSGSYAFSTSGLPQGLNIDAGTGRISGTPTAPFATASLAITVTDTKTQTTASATYSSLTVNDVPVAPPNANYANVQITQNAAASGISPFASITGGTAPFAFTINPALPAGLTLNASTGIISGTPTETVTGKSFVLTGVDNAGSSFGVTFVMTVNTGLTLTTTTVTALECTINANCSFTPFTVTGGSAPIAFTISPALPAGLSINSSTGLISGQTGTASAAATYRVTVTDKSLATAFKDFTIAINQAVTATASLTTKNCTQNTPCSFTPVQGSGGTAPLAYSATPLAAGLSINSANGAISGTPTASQSAATVTVTVTDSKGVSATKTFSLTVNPSVVTSVLVANKTCTATAPCSSIPVSVTSGTGTSPFVYTISPALPAGLAFDQATGQLTGPAAAQSASNYTVSVTDANGAAGSSRQFSLTVNQVLTTVGPSTALGCTQGSACTIATVSTNGGTPPLRYALTGLPNGATLNSLTGLNFNTQTGVISGIASSALAAVNVSVTVTDGAEDAPQLTSAKSFLFSVAGPLVVTVNRAQVGYTAGIAFPTGAAAIQPVSGNGGQGTLTYQIAPTLPSGLTFNTTNGQITGTANAATSTTTYTVTVSDQAAASGTGTFTLTINSTVIANVALANVQCTIGFVCNFAPITGMQGTPAYTYTVPSSPAGLSFDVLSGNFSGTPTGTPGTTSVTVTVRDASGATATGQFQLSYNNAVSTAVAVAEIGCGDFAGNGCTPALPVTPVTISGGSPIVAAFISPALPAGLTFNASNASITGGPATVGIVPAIFTITATDSRGSTSSRTFTLSSITTTLNSATNACTINVACPFSPVTANGGKAPVVYTASATLPTGLGINSTTGAIAGTPTVLQSATSYDVVATDALGRISKKTIAISVATPPALAATVLLPNMSCGDLNGCNPTPGKPVAGSGGTAPLTYSISPALPGGIAIDVNTGVITGIPTAFSGSTSYTITVTDAIAATVARNFNLSSLLSNRALATTSCTTGFSCPFTLVQRAGGTAPFTFSINPTLPAGLSINAINGAITGTPTADYAAATFEITVSDSVGSTSKKSFTFSVNPPITTTQAIAEIGCGDVNGCTSASPFTPVTGQQGSLPYSFALTPTLTLPAGFVFSTNTGAITGTPTAALASTTFTVTLTDSYGSTSSRTFLLSSLLSTLGAPSYNCTGAVICTFTPVTANGGKGPFNYSISPALPAGLAFVSATNPQITGTAAATPINTHTVTITDALGRTTTKSFTLVVN
ncbi:MAG: putative Ig domain-containing protein [Gemmatimonadaceae bacterium]